MDDIVKAAMAKWPDVPDCYGWLALDARGNWRMRDARCQALNLPGDIIRHPSLLNFINRNYQHNDKGQWYFQNGPQRVYVDLEATPYIARTADTGFMLHTRQQMQHPDRAYLDSSGNLFLQSNQIIAQLDDRDLMEVSNQLYENTTKINDDQLLKWIDQTDKSRPLLLILSKKNSRPIPVEKTYLPELMAELGFKIHRNNNLDNQALTSNHNTLDFQRSKT